MKTHHDFSKHKNIKYEFLKSDIKAKELLWKDLIDECQIIVNSKHILEDHSQRIGEIQETIRKLFIVEYLNAVHNQNWNHKLNEFISSSQHNINQFLSYGHQCEIQENCLKIKNSGKLLAELDHPSILSILESIRDKNDKDNTFYIFCIMNVDNKSLNKIYQIYGINEYKRIIHG